VRVCRRGKEKNREAKERSSKKAKIKEIRLRERQLKIAISAYGLSRGARSNYYMRTSFEE